ncbi:hypothetical protein LOTGIDRAFT_122017 [Lottia gigantea]|uniref:Ubiquitin-like domain-containing protein n=1 Tax=Lottia gigantea TaxID=225164 RepID=V4A972_LOTGI|nr:hypothetical protein LOTGIDRAFT_122017 [Lottia gigantea]ESO91620.1 hypothetical protein LOTGIDRAFT_122017 [Lottia gigantea]
MLLFGIFENERVTLEVSPGMRVKDFKKVIQEKLNISDDLCKFDKTVISLTYARAELQDMWVLSDLGIVPGTTIRIQLKEEDNPVLYIKCSHNNETLTIFDDLNIGSMSVKDLKSMVSKRTGLPVGVFRLCTDTGRELFDCHTLDIYSIEAGRTLRLENWDGLNEFFNLASRGFTKQVIEQINTDDLHGRYLLRVALHIASHFGNVDLARSLLKMGGRADEPVGDPPQRQWCKGLSHIDSLKAPIHVATEMGQLGVLRLFVNTDITHLMAADGNGLLPMNIALRQKVHNCAQYLLSKQWTKVNFTKTVYISIKLYSALKKWCELGREKAYMKYGVTKSSLKKRNFDFGPLVSHGVLVDGFSKSAMNGKPKSQVSREEREKRKAKQNLALILDENAEDAEQYFKTVAVTDRPTDRSLVTDRNIAEEPEQPESDDVTDEPKRSRYQRGKKSKMAAKSHASDAPIPLPLISNEQTSRPFFYLNGLREDDVIEPTIELLTKYKGGSQRERAIQSLVIANSFKEKPWLSQIRMALSLSTTALKRDVKRRKSGKKDTSVQCSLTPVHQIS